MDVIKKIEDIEAEMARTQKNKATSAHLGMLKAKLAKLRRELITPKSQVCHEKMSAAQVSLNKGILLLQEETRFKHGFYFSSFLFFDIPLNIEPQS